MARFDLCRFDAGLVMDLQTDIVDIPGSRIVAPVSPMVQTPAPVRGLHPVIQFEEQPYVIIAHLLAAVPAAGLSGPLANYAGQGDVITRALDILFQGY